VKLGGSHASSALLRPWLQAIERHAGRAVVVPGGGPFADCVRDAQLTMGFDHRTAHEMALLAMTQYGRALVGVAACLVMADGIAAIEAALRSRQVPVWSPLPMLRGAADVEPSWDVTSDSLALWLAGQLAALDVLLVKRRRPDAGAVGSLVADGLLDAAFPRFLAGYAGRVFIAAPEDLPSASRQLTTGCCVHDAILARSA
jgi:aspartokinase-like uncharacterized kinase